MMKKSATMSKESRAQQKCSHHWVIKTAAGPISQGLCKFCGAKKDFGNYLTDCLEIEKEDYRAWAESPRREVKKDTEPMQDIFSELGGGDRNAVKAGA